MHHRGSEVAARLIETLLDIVDGVAGAGSNGRGLYLADRTRRAIIAMEGSARRVETAAICVSLAGGAGGRKAAERGEAALRPHRAVLCLFLQIVPCKYSPALLARLGGPVCYIHVC